MQSTNSSQVARACNRAKHIKVPLYAKLQTDVTGENAKISMGRKSHLEFHGNSCFIFLRGSGELECFGKNNSFFIHRADKDDLNVISRHRSNLIVNSYSLPEFEEVPSPLDRLNKSAIGNAPAVQQSTHIQSKKEESKALLDKERSVKSAISPKTTDGNTRATTSVVQSTVKIPVLPASPSTQDDWNALTLMGLGFGGMEYRSYSLDFSKIGLPTNYSQRLSYWGGTYHPDSYCTTGGTAIPSRVG